MLDWFADPTLWIGLGTLIVLEIVLGIDNLIFIAILSEKLPPAEQQRARIIGLSLALFMRLGLLASLSWMAGLTRPLFVIHGLQISGRDLIFLLGGLFLIFKATKELHERLEGSSERHRKSAGYATFWQVVLQIVVLDAVFSLDSIITAVGMVSELPVMMAAVIVAIGVMMVASRPLADFVTMHPTVVVLCLGFLLMVGFSLIADGVGFHIPKGYLYAAIGFSVAVEAYNQIAQRRRAADVVTGDLRARTASAVLRLLGGKLQSSTSGEEIALLASAHDRPPFAPEERMIVQRALNLGNRSARSIMTPRAKLVWLDVESRQEHLRATIINSPYSRFLVARRDIDDLIGLAFAHDALDDLTRSGRIDRHRSVRPAPLVPSNADALMVIDILRASSFRMAVVVDEHGGIEGLITPTDMFTAIAGELPRQRAGARRTSASTA